MEWKHLKLLFSVLSILATGAYYGWVRVGKPLLNFIRRWEDLSNKVAETSRDIVFLKNRDSYLDKKIDAIVYLLDHAILVCDPNGLCVLANPAACELFGTKESALKGHGWYNFIHKDDRSSAEHVMEQMLKSGGSDVNINFRLIHGKTEELVHANYHAIVARGDDGEVIITVSRLNKN